MLNTINRRHNVHAEQSETSFCRGTSCTLAVNGMVKSVHWRSGYGLVQFFKESHFYVLQLFFSVQDPFYNNTCLKQHLLNE